MEGGQPAATQWAAAAEQHLRGMNVGYSKVLVRVFGIWRTVVLRNTLKDLLHSTPDTT
jgi:hypothetical protein